MSANIKKLEGLTLKQQSVDPTSPADGQLHASDGTARSEGLHMYQNGSQSRVGRLRKIDLDINGPYQDSGAQDNILSEKIPTELDGAKLLGVTLALFEKGTSGNTEIDIRYVRGAAAPATIFSVNPAINHATATDILSTGATTEATGTLSITNFLAGDYLILDIKQVPVGGAGFKVTLTFDE